MNLMLMNNQKGVSLVILLLIIGLIAVVAVGGYFLWQYFYGSSQSEQVVCTQDVKLCEDGSYVSRSGSKCEFAQCPVAKATEWIDLSDLQAGFHLKYPTNFFDTGKEPKILSINCGYTALPSVCPNVTAFVSSKPAGSMVQPQKININGYDYCKYSFTDATAGYTYYHDYYAAARNKKCVVIELSTSTANCDNYTAGSQDYQNCVAKNNARPGLLQQIVSTFQFPK